MKREFPNAPILAVGGIIKHKNKILLVKRKNPPDKNLWSIPGGAVELGETLSEAIRREIKEESGISVNDGKIIAIIDKIYISKNLIKYHYCIVDFLFEEYEGNPASGSDAADIKFFAVNEIKLGKDVSESIKNLIGEVFTKNPKLPVYLRFRTKEN